MIATARSFARLVGLRLLAMTAALALVEALLIVPIGLLFRRVFDHSIPRGDRTELVVIGAVLVALALGAALIALWTRHLVLRATKNAVMRMCGAMLERLAELPAAWTDRHDAGPLHAIIVQDSQRIDIMLNNVAARLLPAVIVAVGLGTAMIIVEPLLSLLMVPLLLVMLLVTRALEGAIARRTRSWHRALDRFSIRTHFLLRARSLIRAYGAEEAELSTARGELREVRDSGRAVVWLGWAYVQAGSAIAMIAAIVVLVVGGLAVVGGETSLGSLLAFYALAALQRGQLSAIVAAVPEIISGGESLARVRTLLDAREPQPYGGALVPSTLLPIVLRDVHFSYQEGVPVLRGASMEVRGGELVAIIGPNGAGKSTIASLILGFYRPTGGSVLAGEIPYDQLDVQAMRRRVGSVAQDPLLFSATVAENIGYGEPVADRARIVDAARRATADDFISVLPHGYETPVGDEGSLLSGGERQRIAIARALVRGPELLILDEPTANLDQHSVETLLQILRESSPDRAVIVISHDPEVVVAADRVYALKDGVLSVAVPAVPMFNPATIEYR